jgi:hypothetical protein
MGLVYDDDEGGTIRMRANIARNHKPYDELDASGFYVRHYSNLLYLQFISSNPRATYSERRQADRELVICQRKLDHWKRHPNWRQEVVDPMIIKLKRDWKVA